MHAFPPPVLRDNVDFQLAAGGGDAGCARSATAAAALAQQSKITGNYRRNICCVCIVDRHGQRHPRLLISYPIMTNFLYPNIADSDLSERIIEENRSLKLQLQQSSSAAAAAHNNWRAAPVASILQAPPPPPIQGGGGASGRARGSVKLPVFDVLNTPVKVMLLNETQQHDNSRHCRHQHNPCPACRHQRRATLPPHPPHRSRISLGFSFTSCFFCPRAPVIALPSGLISKARHRIGSRSLKRLRVRISAPLLCFKYHICYEFV